MKSCPVCGKEMIHELVISPVDSGNNMVCENCGYIEIDDPFGLRFREFNSKYMIIIGGKTDVVGKFNKKNRESKKEFL